MEFFYKKNTTHPVSLFTQDFYYLSRMKPDTGFRIKVVVSYVLLVSLTAGTGWYVYKRVYPFLFQTDDRKEEILERSLLISNTISLLYEAEWLGTRFIQDPRSENYDLYKEALDRVALMLDSLAQVTSMQRQLLILDQIDSLLLYRDVNIQDIAKQQREISRRTNKEVERKVDRVLTPLPTITQSARMAEVVSKPAPPVTIREEIIYDTITTAVKQPRRTFLERLSNAFSPSKTQDSIVEIKQIRRTITDSLVRVIPGTPLAVAQKEPNKDTVVQAVMKVLDDVEAQRQKQLRAISLQLELLIETDRALNQQINILLEELNKEWLNTTLSALETRRSSLAQAGNSLSILGAIALFIILLSTILIFVDLNKSRRYRRALEIARIRAEELMNSREKLLLTVTHDIKAPLSAIIGYLDLLRQPSGKSTDQQLREYLDPMTHSAEHVMELLGNLLEYYRLEAKKTQLNPSVTPLNRLFREAIAVFEPTARKKGVYLNLQSDVTPGQCVVTDAMRLRQIVMNLLSNAVKFTEKGHIDLTVSLDNNSLFFCVYDTGTGISAEAQQHIFEEFTRVEQSRNPGKEGVGLGLSIVKRLTDLFGGRITVKQNEEGGSSFCVSLPVELSDQAAQEPAGTDYDIPMLYSAGNPLRVLVVDDEPGQVSLSAEMLRRNGHLVATAGNAAKALSILERIKADVVLTDIQMPNGDGFHLLKQIKEKGDIPVIAVTANSLYTNRDYLERGFTAHLSKPFVSAQLNKVLNNIKSSVSYEGFCLTELGKMVDWDLEAVSQVMNVFYSSARDSLAVMQEAFDKGDHERVSVVAHKMLPMFRQLQSPLAAELGVLERSRSTETEKTIKVLTEGAALLEVIKLHFII